MDAERTRPALGVPDEVIPTGRDAGLSQDYSKGLAAWFSSRPNAKQEVRELFPT